MTGLVLAVDIGSSSLRAGRYDASGHVVGSIVQHRYPHRATRGAHGGFDAVGVRDVLIQVLDEVPSDGVERVSISTLWHSVLAVDADDRPLSEVFSWESTAPARTLPSLAARLDPVAYRARTGSYLHPSYPAAGVWMLRQEGLRPARWTDLTSWLVRQVLGADAGWSHEIAAGSAMWDQTAGAWDEPTLAVLGVHPEEVGAVWRRSSPVRAGFGLTGVEVVPTWGDGVCNSVGMGAVGPTVCAVTAGTSGSLRLVGAGVRTDAPEGLWRYQVADDLTAVGGAISNAGNVVEWWSEVSGPQETLAFAEGAPVPFDGLVVSPDLAGRRGPDYDWDATASMTGLRLHHTVEDVRREMVLAVCASYAELTELTLRCEPRIERLVASGGVVERSPAFAQLLADATGRPLDVLAVAETSLRGAALRAHGDDADPASPAVQDRYEPRPEWHRAIQGRLWALRELRDRLSTRGPSVG